jgi:hypothetical protein
VSWNGVIAHLHCCSPICPWHLASINRAGPRRHDLHGMGISSPLLAIEEQWYRG